MSDAAIAPVIAERLHRFRERLSTLERPAVLILDPVNIGYLTGFTGTTAALLITGDRQLFLTDPRYTAQAGRQCLGFELATVEGSGGYDAAIAREAGRLGVEALAVEADFVTLAAFERLQKNMPGIALQVTAELLAPLRQIKDSEEIAAIREACGLVDRGFSYLLTAIRPGLTEREVAADLEFFLKRSGSEREAFDTIVASGPNSALPHARPGHRTLQAGDFITFDFGARVRGYASDLTRTVVLGTATERQREVYEVVREALAAGTAAIRAGVDGKTVDAAARDLITARGFGPNFGHGLGHGLGRTVHDHVALSRASQLRLAAGMVITVEPGIYLDDWGGVRIEDDVLVTETGCEVLTTAPRELVEVPV